MSCCGLPPPAERTSGDHRRYPADAVERLVLIRVGQRLGLRLDEIRELADACEEIPDCPVSHATGLLRRRIADVERRLTRSAPVPAAGSVAMDGYSSYPRSLREIHSTDQGRS
ncbi:MerR family DNA-binding protein [Streptomyces zaomyceticus]|uniref:MerR family DNA-binding protein n=1 Tax=Streptomyces zaomyceticus TaxID=68286 RepID=A0ABZ1LJY4_9ACTN|nr:MerR family DNA-binding protein [Streptomyces zaomyceticus]